MLGFLERIIDYFSPPEQGYYKTEDRVVDCKNKNLYNTKYNEFEDFYEIFYNRWNTTKKSYIKITKDGFDSLYKNTLCNCDVGLGSPKKVYGEKYNIEEEFSNYCNDIIISIDDNNYVFERNGQLVYRHKNYHSYYKRACIKCEKCFDEYNNMIEEFDSIIKEFDDTERVNEICSR